MNSTLVDALEYCMRDRLQGIMPLTRNEVSEKTTTLDTEHIASSLAGTAPRPSRAIPQHRRAYRIGRNTNLLVCWHESKEGLVEHYTSALWWAGLVRNSLKPVERADLYLFIVILAEEPDYAGQLRDRSRIEADERICRKHVWLASLLPDPDRFLDGTFLARPWTRRPLAPQSIDPMHTLLESAGLTSGLAESWLATLSVPGAPRADDLADQLIHQYESMHDK